LAGSVSLPAFFVFWRAGESISDSQQKDAESGDAIAQV
jgi:hypothetical protein